MDQKHSDQFLAAMAKAESAFDKWHFQEAISIYFEAFLTEPPGEFLHALEDCWTCEYFRLIDEIISKFPQDMGLKMAKLHAASKFRNPKVTIRMCNDLMESMNEYPVLKGVIRWRRFQKSIEAGLSDNLEEDFFFLWNEAHTTVNSLRFRQDIIGRLLASRSPSHINFFQVLSKNKQLTSSLQELFKAKSHELQLFEAIIGNES